ncbi:MAG: PilZ domain-containing protein [Nitrospiraceae bacterium]|nr:PilZ domain-containing protein [Nitrospiraceae bacterium]
MAGKRRHKRIIKRLDTEFSSEGSSFRGTSSNLSEGGLFLRTTKPLPTNTQVDVCIHLPENIVSRLKGTVRWVLKSAMRTGRSGMGIEISENDHHYVNFLNTLLLPEEQKLYKEHEKAVPASPAAKIEHAARGRSGPVPRPKSPPVATRKSGHETEDNEIDSMISSLFSKRQKKQGESEE